MRPLISIIIPTLNASMYIKECLDSICGQSLREIEIMVIDADSNDGTVEVVEEYSRRDKRITILRDTKRSTGFAKNLGIDRARAPYVLIVEPDDYIEKGALSILYENAERENLDIVKGGFNTFIGDDKDRFFFPKSVTNIKNDYGKVHNAKENNNVFRWSMYEWLCLYRKDFLDKYNIRHNETPGAAFQDIGFCFLTLSLAQSVKLLENTVYHYRCDNPNSSVKDKKKIFNTCIEYEYIKARMESYTDAWEKVKCAFVREYFHSNFVCYERLFEELRHDLSERMHNDLIAYNNMGMIDKSRFSDTELQYVNMLLNSADEFDKAIRTKDEKKENNRNRLFRSLESFGEPPQVVICCAGHYGANLHYLLKEHGIKVSAYADNNVDLQGTYLNSIEVISYRECVDRFSDAMYLVANKLKGEDIRVSLEAEYKIPSNSIIVVDCETIIQSLI